MSATTATPAPGSVRAREVNGPVAVGVLIYLGLMLSGVKSGARAGLPQAAE